MARADFIGVHSKRTLGMDASQAKAKKVKDLYFVWQTTDKRIFVQGINAAYDVVDPEPWQINKHEFEKTFFQEVRIFAAPVVPFTPHEKSEEEKAQDKALEEEKKRKKIASQETDQQRLSEEELRQEVKKAAKRLERNIRQEFALHLARIRTGNTKDAIQKIQTILELRKGIVSAHKYMFSDFGIDLRKVTQYQLAVKAYQRALELGLNDANIHFNLARLYLDMKEYSLSWKAVSSSLNIDPEHYYSLKFRSYLSKIDKVALKL